MITLKKKNQFSDFFFWFFQYLAGESIYEQVYIFVFTGDISFKMLDNLVHHSSSTNLKNNPTEIIVGDINRNMLDVGQQRAKKLGIQDSMYI